MDNLNLPIQLIRSGMIPLSVLKVSAGDVFEQSGNQYQNKAGLKLALQEFDQVTRFTDLNLTFIYLRGESIPFAVSVSNRTKNDSDRTESITLDFIEDCKKVSQIKTQNIEDMSTPDLVYLAELYKRLITSED